MIYPNVRVPHLLPGRDTISGVEAEWMWWLIAAAVLIITEIFTGTFVLLMFGIGALVAAGVAAVGLPLPVQLITFVGLSILSLVVFRPWLKHRFFSEAEEPGAGMSSIVGTQALVVERVDPNNGLVKIEGELWRARPAEPSRAFEPGEQVRVMNVDGATALVWRD